MAGRIELPLLYQTRTILRRTRRTRFVSPRYASTQQKPGGNVDQEAPIWSPLAGKSGTKDARLGTTLSSTITASERRAFETILRFAPKADEPKPVERLAPHKDATDTDIDNILKIFTSAVRDHESKRDAALGSRRVVVHREAEIARHKHEGPERAKFLSSEPESSEPRSFYGVDLPSVQSGNGQLDQRKAESVLQPEVEAESSPIHTQQQTQPANKLNANDSQEWSPMVDRNESANGPRRLSSTSPAELTAQPMPEIDKIEPADETRTNTSSTKVFNEGAKSTDPERPILPSAHRMDATRNEDQDAGRFKTEHAEFVQANPLDDSLEEGLPASIQSAVRAKMQGISASLEAAASSKDTRGDIAMWEVVESEIFSIAKYFQPQITPTITSAPFAGIKQFTFSKEKSDTPRQMIEAAERAQRMTASSTPATTPTPPTGSASEQALEPISRESLQILQNVYPAALLLALRLYITHFPTSTYPFLLLPRIRSLGTTSYVLGASPQFYTSLLSLVWMVRGSLREVDNLLGEMERGGVEMDEGTYAVLGAVEDERIADLEFEKKGDETPRDVARVSRGAAWWKRQEQMLFFPRVLDWLDVIAGRLAAKERERLSAA
ncbi:hypothetical protein H2200_011426 [Cladophialophora chaetospira]|uniref:Mtf2-like C-terminal domain-containing protein n=1 Tax=Cladophialophora chaetospira TaxID=386627 RepID=A0AA39CD51_9EURO|nr:hypothetical protein H2200_011426 [Cladophialophora chaetospira]